MLFFCIAGAMLLDDPSPGRRNFFYLRLRVGSLAAGEFDDAFSSLSAF
jgi:hypothetical protein